MKRILIWMMVGMIGVVALGCGGDKSTTSEEEDVSSKIKEDIAVIGGVIGDNSQT